MRASIRLVLVLVMVLALVSPAFAHYRYMHGSGDVAGWVGGPPLPGQGQGLIVGGPGGIFMLSPAHAKGLNTACYALEANPSVVNIRGPGPGGATSQCPHGQ
jgi:hypothetical protein